MKKLLSFVVGLLFFFNPLAVQAEEFELMPQEEIAEAPSLEPMTEKQLNDLFGEDMYIGETNWRGNKVSTKRDYRERERLDPFKP